MPGGLGKLSLDTRSCAGRPVGRGAVPPGDGCRHAARLCKRAGARPRGQHDAADAPGLHHRPLPHDRGGATSRGACWRACRRPVLDFCVALPPGDAHAVFPPPARGGKTKACAA
eukprot:364232-Chlamydomonas_euryale.AAC.7